VDSISRHEQLLRVFHLIDILFGARQPLSTGELKERLQDRGVIDDLSDKSIRRDVAFLERFGYAVKESKKPSPRGGSVQAWSIPAAGPRSSRRRRSRCPSCSRWPWPATSSHRSPAPSTGGASRR
jgi:hypothetical protein